MEKLIMILYLNSNIWMPFSAKHFDIILRGSELPVRLRKTINSEIQELLLKRDELFKYQYMQCITILNTLKTPILSTLKDLCLKIERIFHPMHLFHLVRGHEIVLV